MTTATTTIDERARELMLRYEAISTVAQLATEYNCPAGEAQAAVDRAVQYIKENGRPTKPRTRRGPAPFKPGERAARLLAVLNAAQAAGYLELDPATGDRLLELARLAEYDPHNMTPAEIEELTVLARAAVQLPLLGRSEAAALAGVHPNVILSDINRGRLPASRVGARAFAVKRADLAEYLKMREVW